MNVVLHSSLGCILIWLYPEMASKKLSNLQLGGAVYQSINAWQGVGVLWAGLVEVCEVYAHPPLPVGLLYQHHICQPLWVLNLPNVVDTQQLSCFFFDDVLPLLVELSPPLANRSDLGVHCKTMVRKSRSMPGMSEVDHAKESRWRAMTSAIWSYVPWPRDLPNLNILPPISLSRTSSAGSGLLSQATSTRATPSSLGAQVVTVNTPFFVLRLFS